MSPKTDETVQKATAEAPGAEGEKTDKEKHAKSDKNAEEDLSEEDKKLKEELELCVTRLQEPDQKVLLICILNLNIKDNDYVNRINYLFVFVALSRSSRMHAKIDSCVDDFNDIGAQTAKVHDSAL